ncbi:MAG TPA: DUF3090 domain-containing protein [Acidimicrobiales bacterium]|nr:DUF3090 domain-containing protein [Acidimicrobiales bacterium]
MSTSFEIPEVDVITTDAIGPPGQRVFYLQARQGSQVVSLRLEKTQVAALVAYLVTLLSDLPTPDDLTTEMALTEPVVAEWVVGSLGVSYDEDADRIVLMAEELVVDDDAEDEPGGIVESAHARITATRGQIAALARRGAEVVEAGRPPCPLCNQPMDPEGHMCIRLNGHRQTP